MVFERGEREGQRLWMRKRFASSSAAAEHEGTKNVMIEQSYDQKVIHLDDCSVP